MQDDPQHDVPTPAIMQLEVTNRNDFPINDMYDGIPVNFPVNETVTISPSQALHCFGYPGEARDMAYHMAKRYGWSGREYLIDPGTHGKPRFEQLAEKIIIKPVYYDLVRRDRNEPIPADPSGEDEELATAPEPSDTLTKAGKRRRTPARLGAKTAPRSTRRGREADTADLRLRPPRR